MLNIFTPVGTTYIINYLSSDKSGRNKTIKVAITGNKIPITNQILGFLPIRLANFEVIIGTLSKNVSPKLIIITAPIL